MDDEIIWRTTVSFNLVNKLMDAFLGFVDDSASVVDDIFIGWNDENTQNHR